jgi:hypothetical protein
MPLIARLYLAFCLIVLCVPLYVAWFGGGK